MSNYSRQVCFDNTVAAPAPEESNNPENQVPKFSQDDLNKFLAEDRRKHQGQVKAIQQTLEQTLESKNLSVQEREQLVQRVSELENQGRTKEQQAAHERKQLETQYQTKLTEEKKQREQWETLYKDSRIENELTSAAAGNDSYSPSQMVALLKSATKLVPIQGPDGKFTGQHRTVTVLKEKQKDAEGRETVTDVEHTPESAVRRMKELPEYMNLFKSGVVSGTGANTVGSLGPNGKLDVRKLTPQQYQEIRAKNPELLGLRRDRKRSA